MRLHSCAICWKELEDSSDYVIEIYGGISVMADGKEKSSVRLNVPLRTCSECWTRCCSENGIDLTMDQLERAVAEVAADTIRREYRKGAVKNG